MAGNTKKGITIEFKGDTTKLERSLNDVKRDLQDIESELEDVNRLLKFDPSNVDLLRKKAGLLKEKIDVTKDSLAALKKEQAKMDADGVDKTSEAYVTLRQKILSTEAELKGLNSELKETQSKASMIGRAGDAFQKVGGKITAAGQALLPLSAGALSLLSTFWDIATAVDDIDEIAEKTGLPAEDIEKAQKFREGLEQIKSIIEGLVQTVGVKVMGVLQPIIEKLVEKVQAFADWIAQADPQILTTILGITAAVAALAPVLMAVGTAISAVGAAMSFLAANPVVAIIAAIAAVIAIIVYLIKHWDEVKEKASEVWEHIRTVFGKVAEFFGGLW